VTANKSQSAAAGSKTTWRRMPEGIILVSERFQIVAKLQEISIKRIEMYQIAFIRSKPDP
jgi:hypothetical protein